MFRKQFSETNVFFSKCAFPKNVSETPKMFVKRRRFDQKFKDRLNPDTFNELGACEYPRAPFCMAFCMVLDGYSSTRVSLWDSLMVGRVLEY